MLYLATPSSELVRDMIRAQRLGQMVTPRSGDRLVDGATWALDNGCFTAQWSEDRWRRTLERLAGEPNCKFAVVPDVVGDATATDELWSEHSATVRRYGYRAAYVTQNGCRSIPDDADAVFAGGDNAWKLGKQNTALIAEAKRRGLWCHMGRVNGLRRLRFARDAGYDSVDGTKIAFAPDQNLPILLGWLSRLNDEQQLFGGVH